MILKARAGTDKDHVSLLAAESNRHDTGQKKVGRAPQMSHCRTIPATMRAAAYLVPQTPASSTVDASP